MHEPAHQEYDEIAHHILNQIEQQCMLWHGTKNTSQIWCELLEKNLENCAMLAQLEQDEAGQSVLATLQQLKQLQTEYLSFSSWTSLFDLWVEQAAFVQKSRRQKTHITMIPLAAIRLNHYDAVVVIGCDDRQLPNSQNYGSVFSRSMLHALDEKLPEAHYIQQARDLSQLLSSHRYVDLLWQEYERAGEKNRLSSWLARLQQALPHIQGLPVVSTFGQVQNDPTKSSHAQVSDAALLPKKMSPSAYQTLRSCPYRFYVSYILKLRSPQALREESEFGQIGNVLHLILQNFYQKYREQAPWADDSSKRLWMEDTLLEISQEQWGYLIAQNGQLFSDQQSWIAQIPGWVTWQMEQEKQGWQFAEAEKNITFTLQLESGELLPISGRVDRIDHNALNNLRVLDYKFKNGKDLKKFADTLSDDPQVLIYSNALQNIHQERGHKVEQAGWVSVREASVAQRDYMLNLTQEHLSELEDQMTQDLSKVWAGQDLPANGPDQVCQYCDARGLCRKGMW
jgi:ATP-dependent helicase/nuclease subunit B